MYASRVEISEDEAKTALIKTKWAYIYLIKLNYVNLSEVLSETHDSIY
jgi:hypothetical protein